MKKKYLLTAFGLLLASVVFAQQENIFPATGFAGIGITNPNVPLNIRSLGDSKPGGVVAPSISVLRLGRNGTSNYSYPESAEFRIAHGGPSIWGSRLDLYINGATNQTDIPDQHGMSWLYNGNVGVGTTNPQSKLHLYQNTPDEAGLIVQGNTINADRAQHYVAITLDGDYGNATGNYSQIRSYSNLYDYWGSRLAFFTTSSSAANTLAERMRIDANGNVGIGTAAPEGLLHLSGAYSSINGGNSYQYARTGLIVQANTGGRTEDKGAQIEFVIPANTGGENPWGQGRIITVAGNTSQGNAVGKMILGTRRYFDKLKTGLEWFYGDDIVIDGVGNVGIGTLSPKEKLSVNGKIRAQEIKVEATNWPDYVFEEGYKVRTLEELESYIKTNKRLPDMPSAKEVETNGIALGEMNKLLIQKIEELTLQLIELNKKVNAQPKEFKSNK